MPKNWHHFSAREHTAFLLAHGFRFVHTKGSHEFYFKRTDGIPHLVQVVLHAEEARQSRKTMDMSVRHSGISRDEYKRWINEK